jgi:hypothetical protein
MPTAERLIYRLDVESSAFDAFDAKFAAECASSADRPASRQAASIAPAPAGRPQFVFASPSGIPALRRPS